VGSLRRVIWKLAVALARVVPVRLLASGFPWLVRARAATLAPDEALRMLFRIDASLYAAQGEHSVRYGGGTHSKHRHMRYHDFFVDRIKPGERVLDVGSGIGALAHSIAERSGAAVTAIDIEPRKIEQARAEYRHPGVEYVVGDATQTVPGGPYDVVVLSNVLEHLTDRPRFLRTVLDNVGASRALIRVPLFERDWRVPLKRELGVEWRLDPTHETEYTPESFSDEMEEAGLRISEEQLRWGEIWAEVVTG
jgi:SAM-dependent methyltransferase